MMAQLPPTSHLLKQFSSYRYSKQANNSGQKCMVMIEQSFYNYIHKLLTTICTDVILHGNIQLTKRVQLEILKC